MMGAFSWRVFDLREAMRLRQVRQLRYDRRHHKFAETLTAETNVNP